MPMRHDGFLFAVSLCPVGLINVASLVECQEPSLGAGVAADKDS